MFRDKPNIVYSATDLVRFAECRHHIALDLIDLVTPLEKSEASAEAALLGAKGDQFERAYVDELRKTKAVVEIDKKASREKAMAQTAEAMKAGAEVIFQAALRVGHFFGYVDFLVRCEGKSSFGDYTYQVVDTKLARSERAKFVIQIGLYSDMLVPALGHLPELMHIRLGTGEQVPYRVTDYIHYIRTLQSDFLAFVAAPPKDTYPDPVDYCGMCHWRERCEEQREKDDHLCNVAGIGRSQIKKLNEAGVATIAQLAALKDSIAIPKLANESLAKIRRQARQQVHGRKAGKPTYSVLQPYEEARGFLRMPPPSEGDVFFDFEGDPLHEDGLEYLFGIGYVERGAMTFMPLWAHTRAEEKAAFDKFMRWLSDRIRKYPDLHIYHYAQYEVTALKRMMSLYGMHESAVDRLLQEGRFVDLYKVVREALVISEPSYSLKYVEKFFMPAREGEVQGGGESMVKYDEWRQTGNPELLQQLEDYNRFDVEATLGLVRWLREIQPRDVKVQSADAERSAVEKADAAGPSDKVIAHEERLATALSALDKRWQAAQTDEDKAFWQLTMDLVDFYRRAEKPGWWAMFARADADDDDLLYDMECIACCEMLDAREASRIFPDEAGIAYRYPDQDFKLDAGDDVRNARTTQTVGTILAVSREERAVMLKPRKKAMPLPEKIHLGASGPLSSEPLRKALFAFATAIGAGPHPYRAVEDLLRRRGPRFKKPQPVPLEATVETLLELDDGLLFIQGPPGCGKTFTASRLIVELLRKGKTVGVASNGHKAIHNLLDAIEEAAKKASVKFNGCKRSSDRFPDTEYAGKNIGYSPDITPEDAISEFQLVAGTVYFYAQPPSTTDKRNLQPLDYLFIDEAGQVSLANAVVMGMRARNIVLVGDQMQLGQPIQGVHPGDSGLSTLDYLLAGHATVAEDRGVLLDESWRMHPLICQFISDAVYDGRLRSHPSMAKQSLVLNARAAGPVTPLKPAGLLHVPVSHTGNAQRSDEEAQVIASLYADLLKQKYRDAEGKTHKMTADNILVVAPYNAQVNLLKEVLPDGARVGTVDKFQGQEAEVVLISMATSNAETLPRNIEFLFSRNRLNVAISRARCLSVLVCSPALLRIPCATPGQMRLVNTLGWFAAEAEDAPDTQNGYERPQCGYG